MKKRILIALVVVLALAATATLVWANMGGLVSYWPLDGSPNDAVNGNDGTVYEAAYVGGKVGQALSFDGSNDYVQLPASNSILDIDTFTVEAWFKTSVNHPPYGVGTMEGRIVNLHRMATASTAVSLYVEKDKIGLLYYTGSAHVWVKYTVDYHDGEWHHIAVTHDATTYRLYYDGAQVASQVDGFGGFGTFPAYLGTYNSTERFFNGVIDEVGIWNRALTADEVAFLASPNVSIDIKPGSDLNAINLGSKGVIPVAILSTDIFDATQVDPGTVTLAGAGVAVKGKGNNLLAHPEDVNGDSLLDLVVQVETENLVQGQFQDGYAILEGRTFDGLPFRGQDEIVIVPQ